MFDRFTDPSQSADTRGEAIRGIERLCETFDPLLENPAHSLYPHQTSELAALARIFDLSTSREPVQVWSDLRTMLVLQPETDVVANSRALTVMVVEDDADIAAGIMSALGDAGHRIVGPFESADAAEVSAAIHQVDLALVDINLASETDGIDLARSLKARWGLPTILMSGDITALSVVGDMADALILKPFTAEALLNAITGVMGSDS